MDRWPNFFIVGAPRCGTTSLYEYLNQTPGVFMSPIKEPNYFCVSVNPNIKLSQVIRDKKKYLNLFKHVKDEIAIGEASVPYLWDPKAPLSIHEAVPDARIIMILRDPVERALSHYLLLVGLGSENLSFSDAIRKAIKAKPDYSGRIIETGLYFEQVKRYEKIFGLDQIKIIIFEEFVADTWNSVKDVLRFLGVKNDPPGSINEVHNVFTLPRGKLATKIITNPALRNVVRIAFPRSSRKSLRKIFTTKSPKPKMLPQDRKFLEDVYRNDVIKLEKFLGRSLPWSVTKS